MMILSETIRGIRS